MTTKSREVLSGPSSGRFWRRRGRVHRHDADHSTIQCACAALLVREVLCRTVHAEFKALPKFAEASAGFNARGAAGGNGPLKIGSCSTCTGTPADAAIGHSAGSLRLACGVPVTTNGFRTGDSRESASSEMTPADATAPFLMGSSAHLLIRTLETCRRGMCSWSGRARSGQQSKACERTRPRQTSVGLFVCLLACLSVRVDTGTAARRGGREHQTDSWRSLRTLLNHGSTQSQWNW